MYFFSHSLDAACLGPLEEPHNVTKQSQSSLAHLKGKGVVRIERLPSQDML